MNVIHVDSLNNYGLICIGKQGENNATKLRFEAWKREADAIGANLETDAVMTYKHPDGNMVYKHLALDRYGVPVWTITADDLTAYGNGEIDYKITTGDVCYITPTVRVHILRGIS